MLHQNREEFIKALETTSSQTAFPMRLLEKDYYLTRVLSDINTEISPNLVFKGGTCLNKIYYEYFRLSEDLDFSLKIPSKNITRGIRRNAIKPIKKSVLSYVQKFDIDIENLDQVDYNQSMHYIYYLSYNSVLSKEKESIKLEISLRANPLMPIEEKKVVHKFCHPFTGETLFNAGKVTCLALDELVAEKMRAAATRKSIAVRDFYDLNFFLKKGFDFEKKQFVDLFQAKLAEDSLCADLKFYNNNFGRSNQEIDGMKLRIKDELFPVLSVSERNLFNLQEMLKAFNNLKIWKS